MNPEFIDRMGWEMAEVYGAITDQILINLAKYFPYYKPGSSVPKSAFTYQAAMLAQMGQVNAETMRIIRNGLKNADSALQGVLEQAIIDSVSKAEKPLLKAVKAGIFSPPLVPVVSPNQMKAFTLYYKQAADKLNLVNTVMLESTQSAYRQAVTDVVSDIELADRMNRTQIALDVGAGETITGVSSWNQAVRHSIEKLKQGGITGFIDHAGHRWSAEAYTAMDIRTTVMNTGRAAVWETNENFGNDLYLVSYHNGARPLCYDWQNKVISSANLARDTVDLDGNTIHVYAQSETTYGEPAGLFGINCKHYPSPFIPGVSIIRGEPQDPEENAKTYAESQHQRQLERKLREEKRDVMMAKAQGAPQEEIDKLQAKARQTSSDIDTFCEETGRARHRDREGVYTQRSFPSKDSYDVSEFERTQKDKIEQFYKTGGAQKEYKTGVLDGKATQTPAPDPTPTTPPAVPVQEAIEQTLAEQQTPAFTPAMTREEAETYAQAHFGGKYSSMSYKGIDVEFANTCNRVLSEVSEKYDLSVLKGIQPMDLRTKMFRGTTAEAAYHWGGDGTLFINPTYYKTQKAFAAHKAEIDRLTKTCIDSGEAVLKSGKYTGTRKAWLEALLNTGRQCVAQSHDFIEGTFVHESGHMLEDKVFRKAYDEIFGTKGVFEGVRQFLSASQAQYGGRISAYAVTSLREYVAESFTAWWYGETELLDPALVRVFETTMKGAS